MPSFGTLKADTLTHSTAGSLDTNFVVNGSSKAWVNFNGTSTLAIDDSFNMASVTDNGTGNYTPAATNSMNNTDYAFSLAAREESSGYGGFIGLNDSDNQTASGFQIRCRKGSVDTGTGDDRALVTTAYFGDLA